MKRSQFRGKLLLMAAVVGMSVDLASAEENSGVDLSLADLLNIKLQTGSFLDLDLTKSPLSMTVIDRSKVEMSGARDLSELLEIYVPGFQVAVNKWNGKVWMMRGITNDRNTKLLVLVNGHKMNTEARDGFIQEQAMGLLDDVERVEVLRGPAGMVYGSGAIAGIVNIVTRRPLNTSSSAYARAGTWSSLSNTSGAVQGTVFGKLSDERSVMASLGWEKSDGSGFGASRIYGHPQYPSPDRSASPTVPGSTPSNGSAGYTPGNWKASAEYDIKGLRLYGRATHQVQSAASYGILDPWSQSNSVKSVQTAIDGYKTSIAALNAKLKAGTATATDSLALVDQSAKLAQLQALNPGTVFIDGVRVNPTDPYWQNVDNSDLGRREYVADNVMADATYDILLGDNTLKFHAAFDGNSNIIRRAAAVGYELANPQERGGFTVEEFGERRYTLGSTYLMRSLSKLQFAVGLEQRFDDIGNSLDGHNYVNEVELRKCVEDILYSNTALYTEGWYDLLPNLGVDFGLRWDGHTRTIDDGGTLNGKIATVYTPAPGHVVKAIFQTSSNNGSADNYEFGRNVYDEKGRALETWHFDNAFDTTSNILPGVPLSDYHALDPEKVYSFELTASDDLGAGFGSTVSASYNMVRDLFAWVPRPVARVMNIGRYDNLNFDLEADYESRYLDAGFNHAVQMVVNTDLAAQNTLWTGPNYLTANTVPNYYTKNADGSYSPIPKGDTTVVMNPVAYSVTGDGENFIGMATHLSKLFVDVKPTSWLTIHSDVRVFWGLWGRDSALQVDQSSGYDTRSVDTDPITKWNASVHTRFPGDWTVGLYVYDILGTTSPSLAANTFRWAPYGFKDRDLFAVDLRSFAMDVRRTF